MKNRRLISFLSLFSLVLVLSIYYVLVPVSNTTLNDNGINAACLYGATSHKERDEIIRKFKNGEIQVLVTNPHTLDESVSLHKNCHYAIYFEYTFNLTHMLQSRDRIHRLGLPDGTKTTYYFTSIDGDDFACNSIDLKTLERLKMKEDRMLKAVESKQLFIKSDSFKDDIDFIFGKKT